MSTRVRSVVRPDCRCLVRPRGTWTAAAAAEAVALATELQLPALAHLDGEAVDEHAFLLGAGFTASRRQVLVVVEVQAALEALRHADLPPGVVVRSAADVDVDLLRALDDELRQEVPGTSGWRSSVAEFRAHTFEDPAFDPRTYLVAVDDSSGEHIGLVRIWMNPDGPRLGMLGVRGEHRRRGIGPALLRRALAAVLAVGEREITTEFDATNGGSRAIAERLGARPVGTRIEYSYEPPVEEGAAVPGGKERSRVG
jgi:RimJ/RimL family protein N-acetyltransferase